jgi:hypothetical protein
MHDDNRTKLYIEGAWVPSTGGDRGHHRRRQQARITLIGDIFNVAARVEQLTKTTGDAILLTHQTVDALDGRLPGLTDRGSHALKGKSAPGANLRARPSGDPSPSPWLKCLTRANRWSLALVHLELPRPRS